MPFDGKPELPVVAEPKTAEGKLLLDALGYFGPNGEKWCQMTLWERGGRVCAQGALAAVAGVLDTVTGRVCTVVGDCEQTLHPHAASRAQHFLDKACGLSAPIYNDMQGRKFSDIRAVFLKAIELAEGEHAV